MERELTHKMLIGLFFGASGTHGVGLSSARLTVGQNGNIITLDERANTLAKVVPQANLIHFFTKNTIENEQLLPLS